MSTEETFKIIDKYYASDPYLRDILIRHSMQVADLALDIIKAHHLPLDPERVKVAGLLHDIGICRTYAPSIGCHGSHPYLMHGIIGAGMIRKEGLDDGIANVAAHHTGAGITEEDIVKQNLPLPPGDYCPHNMLEKLICYADKFYSKSGDMQRKSLEKVRDGISRFGSDSLGRFDELHKMFG